MNRSSRRRRGGPRPIIIVLLLVASTLAVIDRTQDGGPLSSLGNFVRDGAAAVGNTVVSVLPGDSESDADEVDQLKSRVAELEGQLAQVDDARRERDELRLLMDLPSYHEAEQVQAKVTAIGVSNFNSTVELSSGTDAGIEVGMVVVNSAGLVGRIIESSRLRSTVLLIGDSTSNVGVRFSLSGEIGVAVGQGTNQSLDVELIDIDSDIKVDEIAVTSGTQNSLFPPGIPVGRVLRSDVESQELRRNVELRPFVNASQLDTVSVVQWRR